MRVTNPNNMNDYSLLIKAYNPEYTLKEHRELIASYRTPKASYLYKSVRDLPISEITYDTLKYIITECYVCSNQERYKASIIIMYKMYQDGYSLLALEKAKLRAINFLKYPPRKPVTSICHCNKCKFDLRLSV